MSFIVLFIYLFILFIIDLLFFSNIEHENF